MNAHSCRINMRAILLSVLSVLTLATAHRADFECNPNHKINVEVFSPNVNNQQGKEVWGAVKKFDGFLFVNKTGEAPSPANIEAYQKKFKCNATWIATNNDDIPDSEVRWSLARGALNSGDVSTVFYVAESVSELPKKQMKDDLVGLLGENSSRALGIIVPDKTAREVFQSELPQAKIYSPTTADSITTTPNPSTQKRILAEAGGGTSTAAPTIRSLDAYIDDTLADACNKKTSRSFKWWAGLITVLGTGGLVALFALLYKHLARERSGKKGSDSRRPRDSDSMGGAERPRPGEAQGRQESARTSAATAAGVGGLGAGAGAAAAYPDSGRSSQAQASTHASRRGSGKTPSLGSMSQQDSIKSGLLGANASQISTEMGAERGSQASIGEPTTRRTTQEAPGADVSSPVGAAGGRTSSISGHGAAEGVPGGATSQPGSAMSQLGTAAAEGETAGNDIPFREAKGLHLGSGDPVKVRDINTVAPGVGTAQRGSQDKMFTDLRR